MSAVQWKRILATTDFSPFSNKAVSYAHDLAEQTGAELHVLHVVPNSSQAAAQHGATGTYDPSDTDELTTWLGTLLGETGTIRRVESIQIGHNTPEKIAHYAQAKEIDLIVMASHGRTGLAHFWLGSTTEKVIRSVHCPVLVIRPSSQEELGGAK